MLVFVQGNLRGEWLVPAETMGQTRQDVLVVDDDADIRNLLSSVLAIEGYAVTSASNGEEALSKLRGMPGTRLILLDLRMPVMDGWEFRAEQSRDPALCAIPVVVLSGDGDLERATASFAGASVLKKPFDLEELITVVQRYF
jgi:CheY-like chemotaxis protein